MTRQISGQARSSVASPAAALVWRRAKGPAPASRRRGRLELVRANGRRASPDVGPSSQLGGLTRGGARDAADEGAYVGEGHGRIHTVTCGCSRTPKKSENQLLILIFHLICTPQIQSIAPTL